VHVYACECTYRHENWVVRTLRALRVSQLRITTAGGREFESRRPDWLLGQMTAKFFSEVSVPGESPPSDV
jgi:hypothetical protein